MILQPRFFLPQSRNLGISRAKDDANNILLASRDANMDYISVSEKEALDNSINQCINSSMDAFLQRSLSNAWQIAYNSSIKKKISELEMARDAGASEDMIAYNKEELAWV